MKVPPFNCLYEISQDSTLFKVLTIFNQLFKHTAQTELVIGADEPIYLPHSETGGLNRIVSTRDHLSSALHEISHWCIAGEQRRALVDYGYWYEADGRSESQQRQFESMEVKPQALEWLLSEACGQSFRLSVDNINQPLVRASDTFRQAVCLQATQYFEEGLPERARIFHSSLLSEFNRHETFSKSFFSYDKLV